MCDFLSVNSSEFCRILLQFRYFIVKCKIADFTLLNQHIYALHQLSECVCDRAEIYRHRVCLFAADSVSPSLFTFNGIIPMQLLINSKNFKTMLLIVC